ncbi:acyl-CoA desaturase [Algoriphagus halophytocola]|uniref:Acyl-CoA desaturase n=1 Tax=Algoriphagus halophytocola TaxID=2991499 RepID=A0ABY6MJQ2_9BACT|nr:MULTISPECIES: acyl-CoA desaturase [unclassified Algoriphagus]UZD22511.1 acyl-CoA desaturase [Algoriphagus sp. TR-M5]WBL43773.1 acyl-CoA desaturase [Algoriphagus sp. TR-M9]
MSLYLVPIALVITGVATTTFQLFACYITAGIGMAGVGMGVMHDANHGSYSKKKSINTLVGSTLEMVGASSMVWKIQHNVLHHSYTNIDEHDDDINAPFFLRFSPNGELNGLHKYQHLYAWFFYSLSTLSWVTAKDFIRLTRYHKKGLVKGKNAYRNTILKLIAFKLIYFFIVLGLPIIFTSFSVGLILLAFVAMHFVTGFTITMVFQIAHIVEVVDFPVADHEGIVEGERMLHQLATTCNFSPNSRALGWFVGGLNYQVEHHLFPDICHVHYRKIAPIVKATAQEFNVPYYSKPNFILAVLDHFKMLYVLGNSPKLEPVKV